MNKTSFELLTQDEDQEEAHYVHTINDVVELMVVYGYDKVIGDLKETIRVKEAVKGGIQC